MPTVHSFSPQSVPTDQPTIDQPTIDQPTIDQPTMDESPTPVPQPNRPRRNPILRRGDRHFLVPPLQTRLNQRLTPPDFPALEPLTVDGIFGPKTERRVMLAQFRYVLFQNGIADDMLWRSLQKDTALITQFPVLQRYSMGQSVGAVQQLFKTVGLYDGRVDLRFGPEIEAAVQDFQARQPPPMRSVIAANGIVNHHTWVALEKLAIFHLTAE